MVTKKYLPLPEIEPRSSKSIAYSLEHIEEPDALVLQRREIKLPVHWTGSYELKLQAVVWASFLSPSTTTSGRYLVLSSRGTLRWTELVSNDMNKLFSIYLHGIAWLLNGWGTMLQAGRSRVREPMIWKIFINLPPPSSHTRPWDLLGSNRN
jgi:hypothetical protein